MPTPPTLTQHELKAIRLASALSRSGRERDAQNALTPVLVGKPESRKIKILAEYVVHRDEHA